MAEQPLPPSRTPDGATLHSWKEIAAYLNRDVSTVKRWEQHEALPIHRHMHRLRGTVYAEAAELDAWRAGRRSPDEAPPRTDPARWPTRIVASAALLLVALVSVGDSRAVVAATGTGQASGKLIQRRILSQQDMDLNNFYSVKPSPDGHRLAYSAIGDREAALYVRDVTTGKVTKLTNGEHTHSPVWSPDGKRLAYVAAPTLGNGPRRAGAAVLKIVDLTTRASSVLVEIDGTEVRPLNWSPDGAQLLCSLTRPDRTSSLVLVSVLKAGLLTLVTQGWDDTVNSSASFASFSADGRYVAFSGTDAGNRNIYVLTVDGRDKYRITQEPGPNSFPLWSPTGDRILYQRDDGAWTVKVSAGRPQGAPQLVSATPFDQPISWTATGGFSYVTYNRAVAEYALPVNPESGEATAPAQRLELGPAEKLNLLAWSPDMKSVAASSYDGKIRLYAPTDRSFRSFDTGGGPQHLVSALWWSSDGKTILFVPNQDATVMTLSTLDGSVHQLFAPIADAERFRVNADGTRMLFFKGRRGTRQLVVSNVGNPDGRVIASEPDTAGDFSNWVRPAFSADGSQVLFARATTTESALWTLGVDGSNPRRLATVRESDSPGIRTLHYAMWSPDGRHIAYDNRNSIFVVDVRTGGQQMLALPKDARSVGVMYWSPDGRQIGFQSDTMNLELWVADNLLAALKPVK